MKRNQWLSLLVALIAVPCWGQVQAQITFSQGTAVQILTDPIYDTADLASGTWTTETGLTIEDTEVLLIKCAESTGTCGASAAKNDTDNCAHVANGQYECDLDATDTNTVGQLRVYIQDNTAVTPFFRTYVIIETAVFEAALADGAAPLSASGVVDEFETQSQADPTGFHVNVMETNGVSQTGNDNGADINAILADTNELQTDLVNGGRLDLILDATLADTNELQGDWVNGGRLDLILDARASQASVDDVPTVAEFEARTLAAGSYFDSTTDTVRQASYTNADGDVCVFVISETEPHITFDCTEAP